MSADTPTNEQGRPMLYDPTERRIRSFVTRAGRLSTGQARALETYGPHYLIEYRKEAFDFHAPFGRTAPLILEIGFGMGDTTAHIAAARPDVDFIGIEVHAPGVGALLKQLGENAIDNVRVIQHDAVDVVAHMIPPESLAGIHVYFPDPWPKKRHHKRRLIQPPFAELAASRIAPGGYLHVATDWQEYAEHVLEVLRATPSLANTAADFAPRPATRPETKFERRGLKLGHGVWDIVFTRKP